MRACNPEDCITSANVRLTSSYLKVHREQTENPKQPKMVVDMWLILAFLCWSLCSVLSTEPYGTWTYVGGSTIPTNFTVPDNLGVNLGAQFVQYSIFDERVNFGPTAVTSSCGDIDSSSGLIYTFGGQSGTFAWNSNAVSNMFWMFNTSNMTWTWLSGKVSGNSSLSKSLGNYPSFGGSGLAKNNYPGSRIHCSLAAAKDTVFLFGGFGYGSDSNCSGGFLICMLHLMFLQEFSGIFGSFGF
jgi:hypothetical protein